MLERKWAFWRRTQYGAGLASFFAVIFLIVYMQYVYSAPTCFDGNQNGGEAGVDCGGACTRICAFTVTKPQALWARSFRVQNGQYNAVAYIENKNRVAASPKLTYTFSLHDAQGLIVERKGETILPPDSVYPVFEAKIQTGTRVPTQTFIALDEIAIWQPATVGRDQFTVTERKLSEADGTPRLDAKIRNNALTKADSVEVVATIFDTNNNALTSSRTFIDNFQPRSEASVVFTWPEPIAKTVRSCEVPTDVMLAIDLSGSMDSDGTNPPQPLTAVLSAAQAFTTRMQADDQVGVVTFATDAIVQTPLTSQLTNAGASISKLFIAPKEQLGSTNQGAALLQVLQELSSSRHSTQARKVAILLTDGLATAPEKDPQAFALLNAQKVKDAGINLFTIGLGKDVNMEFVKSLASVPSQSYQAISAKDVDSIYKMITASLCENGAAVIDIIPKTDASFEPLQ